MTTTDITAAKIAASRHGMTPAQYLAHRNAGMKWCRACQEWRPLADYRPSTSTWDHVRPLCTRHYTRREEPTHGLNRYRNHGCRCATCRAANAEAARRARKTRRTRPAAADRAGHGTTSTYNNYGCRCDPCRAAQSVANAAYRNKRKAQTR